MKRAIWLTCVALLTACNCDGGDNLQAGDAGGDDVSLTDVPGEPDTGDDADATDAGGDMAMLPEGVSIPELTAPLVVRFDENAVMHLDCEVTADCFATQGYYHAAHRFIQMDIQRRFASGRLAGLIGNAALGIDVEMRAIMSTRDGEPLEEAMWEASSQDVKDGITAYTRGVNAFLDDVRAERNGARVSSEYDLELIDPELEEWTVYDSISAGLLLLESLSNDLGDELGRSHDFAELTAEEGLDLIGTMSATRQATMPNSGESYDRIQTLLRWPDAGDLEPALERLRPRQALYRRLHDTLSKKDEILGRDSQSKGSNNWVIGGDLTTSGMPILANDPHLGLQHPALWYMVEIHAADGLHLSGVSLPGMPGVLLGHNEEIAWGATVVFCDLSDVYNEELIADGSAVIFEGGEVPIIEVEHEFDVARSNPVTRTLRFVPHHGPMFEDELTGETISLRWTGNDARTDLDMFFGLFEATNVDEAREAIKNSTSTNQNWIVADREGNIGWFPFSAVPERPWASLSMPPWAALPGDGSAEWGPRIDPDDLPQMRNPANGFVATANTDPLGTSFDGDPTNEPYGYLYAYGEVGGFRQDAIIKRIEDAGTDHTPEISMDMQGDSFIVLRDWIRPHVQSVIDTNAGALSADAEEMWAQVESWDGTCPTGLEGREPDGPKSNDGAAASIGCAAFHFALYSILEATFADDFRDLVADHDWQFPLRTLVVMLNDPDRLQNAPDVYWDNSETDGPPETMDDVILAGLERAAERLRAELGPDPDDWRWGKVHTVLLFANVFNNAGFVQYNHGPFAAPGGSFAINVATPKDPSEQDWGFTHGPSMRHVSEFTADGIVSHWTLPGGQRHFRDSPYYDHLLDGWLATDHFQMPFESDDVQAAAMETIEVAPR